MTYSHEELQRLAEIFIEECQKLANDQGYPYMGRVTRNTLEGFLEYVKQIQTEGGLIQ
jgi:hypothetical protein